MNIRYIFVGLLLIAFSTGCEQPAEKVVQANAAPAAKPGMQEPFKYHKLIQVAPGNYYDVFSWGRGTQGGAKYIIMRSDSSDQQFGTTEGDLEGQIQNVLNADLDTDGNPEIIIHARSIDTNRYTSVFIYEFNGGNARKLDFPRLTPSQREGFRGNDEFFVKKDSLMRSFPVYNGTQPTAQKRVIAYTLRGNSFRATQVNKEPETKGAKVPISVAEKPKVAESKAIVKRSAIKRANSKKQSRKRRRRS